MLICHAILSTRWGSRQYMSHQTSRRCINVHAILKKKSSACLPRLPQFSTFSHFLSAHSPPGLLFFSRWCQESFQSILSWEAKATKRVRLRLLKAYPVQKRKQRIRETQEINLPRQARLRTRLWLNREGQGKLPVFTVSTLSKLLNFYWDTGQLP